MLAGSIAGYCVDMCDRNRTIMEDNVTPTCPKCDSVVRPMEEFFDDSKPPYAQFKGYYWCVGCKMWVSKRKAFRNVTESKVNIR